MVKERLAAVLSTFGFPLRRLTSTAQEMSNTLCEVELATSIVWVGVTTVAGSHSWGRGVDVCAS